MDFGATSAQIGSDTLSLCCCCILQNGQGERAASKEGRKEGRKETERERRANVAAKFNLGPLLFPRAPRNEGKEGAQMDGWAWEKNRGGPTSTPQIWDSVFVIFVILEKNLISQLPKTRHDSWIPHLGIRPPLAEPRPPRKSLKASVARSTMSIPR